MKRKPQNPAAIPTLLDSKVQSLMTCRFGSLVQELKISEIGNVGGDPLSALVSMSCLVNKEPHSWAFAIPVEDTLSRVIQTLAKALREAVMEEAPWAFASMSNDPYESNLGIYL